MKITKDTARKINLIVWVVAVIVIMSCVYNAWSVWGPYTFGSFFASLVMHGGGCAFTAFIIDESICNYFDKRENGKE